MNLEMDCLYDNLKRRMELVEHAVFGKNKEIGQTIFDIFDKKISDIQIFSATEAKKLDDSLNSFKTDFTQQNFVQESKILQCLQLGE